MIKLDCVNLPDKLSLITDNFPFEQTIEVVEKLWRPLPPYQKIIGAIFDTNEIDEIRDSRLFHASRM